MHISPISINTNFKAKLSPEVKELLLNGAENIAAEKGKNSRVYKKYKNNIKKILDNSPETRVDIVSVPRFDDVYFYSYGVRNRRKSFLEGDEWNKEELASPSNVEYLAQRIMLLSLENKLHTKKFKKL